MAYAESTIGGTYGGSFRVWVNAIRAYDGGPAENFEDWRVEGGVNRVSSAGNRIYSSGASYNTQLGMNGMGVAAGFNYDFNTALGTKVSWGSGTTRVYRNSAGVGFGFQSRTDVNLNNSPYLTSGWTVRDHDTITGVQTKYRQAYLTNLSQDIYDVDNPWVEFDNPGGIQVNAWLELINNTGATRYFQTNYVGSRHTWYLDESQRSQLRTVLANQNSAIIRYVIESTTGGAYFYDYRDRTYTITNADPTFNDFAFADTNAATVAITGNNQVLIQGKSTLATTVSVANRALANKQANMSSYTFTLGAYSQGSAWSNTVDVVHNLGTVSVTGDQNLSVRAIDSRTNSKTVTKSLTILPYTGPRFYNAVGVKYTNNYDMSGGITVDTYQDGLGLLSPLTLAGVDKNAPLTVTYDISKDGGAYTGSPTTIAVTQEPLTGKLNIDPVALGTSILGRMNTIGEDNTVFWNIKFTITDKLQTSTLTSTIDIGRPIFRIGTDRVLYYNEFPMSSPGVENYLTASVLDPDANYFSTIRITALASGVFFNEIANPTDGKKMLFSIKDNGTTRGITWPTKFRSMGATAPISTTPNKTLLVGTMYNAIDDKWDVIAVSQEA